MNLIANALLSHVWLYFADVHCLSNKVTKSCDILSNVRIKTWTNLLFHFLSQPLTYPKYTLKYIFPIQVFVISFLLPGNIPPSFKLRQTQLSFKGTVSLKKANLSLYGCHGFYKQTYGLPSLVSGVPMTFILLTVPLTFSYLCRSPLLSWEACSLRTPFPLLLYIICCLVQDLKKQRFAAQLITSFALINVCIYYKYRSTTRTNSIPDVYFSFLAIITKLG